MKKYMIISALFFSLSVSAQKKFLFDTSNIDANTKLIGRYPQFDETKTYKNFNFIIEDPADIRKMITMLVLGEEVENSIEDPNFRIALVQNFHEVQSWIINPSSNTAMYNGHTYKFDVGKVKTLAKKFPFDYTFDKVSFKSKDDYQSYMAKQKENRSFLFSYAPQFKYEGSFDIAFPRNNQFSSPKAISDYLTPLIEKIVSEKEYTVSYSLNEKNMRDQNQFTMTISGSRKLYDTLILEGLTKEQWKPSDEQGWFFYKKN